MKKSILLLLTFFSANCFSQGSCASPDAQFYSYTGGNITYATANSNGWCYNGLVAGQTYCFYYTYPTGFIEMDWQPNGCGSCGSSYISSGGGGCSSTCCSCSIKEYDQNCNFLWNGIKLGTGCPHTVGQIYIVCFTVPSGCGGMSICPLLRCSTGTCIVPLPVTWGDLDLKQVDSSIEVKWTVYNELNNDYFVIERLIIDSIYTSVGVYTGRGTTSLSKTYVFTDDFPIPGINYYRIKQVDYDGNFTYSEIKHTKFTTSDEVLKTLYYTLDGKQIDETSDENIYCVKIIYVSGKVEFKMLIKN